MQIQHQRLWKKKKGKQNTPITTLFNDLITHTQFSCSINSNTTKFMNDKIAKMWHFFLFSVKFSSVRVHFFSDCYSVHRLLTHQASKRPPKWHDLLTTYQYLVHKQSRVIGLAQTLTAMGQCQEEFFGTGWKKTYNLKQMDVIHIKIYIYLRGVKRCLWNYKASIWPNALNRV